MKSCNQRIGILILALCGTAFFGAKELQAAAGSGIASDNQVQRSASPESFEQVAARAQAAMEADRVSGSNPAIWSCHDSPAKLV